MSLRASIEPDVTPAYAGIPVFARVTVANTADLVDAFDIRVLGVDADWVKTSPGRMQLFPGAVGTFDLTIDLPDDFPAGRRILTVQIRSDLKPDRPTLLTLALDVDTRPRLNVQVHPVQVVGGKSGDFAVTVENLGNTTMLAKLVMDDPEAVVAGTFDRQEMEIPPGEQRSTPLRVKGKRPWAGGPVIRSLSVGVEDGLPGSEQMAVFVQTPRISRSLFSFVGLLIAASIFGVVFSKNLKNVVDATTTDDKILEQAFGNADPGAGVAPGAITGTVVARTSKTGIAGATVEIYLSEVPDRPIRSVATGADGTYTVDNLGPGPFRVHAVAAGYDNRWYGDVAAFDNSPDIAIDPGVTRSAVDILLGGQPATVSGIVLGGNVEGATVDLLVPAAVTGGTQDSIINSMAVDATGAFSFANIPAPGSYNLRVRKVGSVTTNISFELSGGEVRTGVTVQLRSGDGSVSGLITGPDGPLGAATIALTSPDMNASTLSLTTDSPGSFNIPDLLTPASYAVSISLNGYATENLTISLASGQQINDLVVQLEPSSGSISGLVRDQTGSPIGGIPVVASDGENEYTTTSLTIDDPTTPDLNEIGSFQLASIPAPGIYTVTIGGASVGYAPIVRNVVLRSNNLNASLTIDLVPATGTVSGLVTDAGGSVGGVSVRISSGASSRITTTATSCTGGATSCVGTYRFDSLPIGAYTLTFSRVGSETVARQIVVGPGSAITANVTLQPRAGIEVIVCLDNGATTEAQCLAGGGGVSYKVGYHVRIWKESAYPAGALLGAGLTAADGSYSFLSLDAPLRYVIEVAPTPGDPATTSRTVVLPASTTQTIAILSP